MSWDAFKGWLVNAQRVARAYSTALQQVDVSADIVTAAGADVSYAGNPLKGIYVGDVLNTGSLVYIKMHEDTAFVAWDCVKGMYIEGIIDEVGGTGTGTTAEKLVGLR